jgi:hypothetical protein
MDELDLIKEMSVLKLEPGDILVLKYPQTLSLLQIEGIRHYMMKVLSKVGKEDTPVVILEGGLELEKLGIPNWKETIISIIEEEIMNGGRLRSIIEDI